MCLEASGDFSSLNRLVTVIFGFRGISSKHNFRSFFNYPIYIRTGASFHATKWRVRQRKDILDAALASFFLLWFPHRKIQFPEQPKNLSLETIQPEINRAAAATNGMDILAVYFLDIMLQ